MSASISAGLDSLRGLQGPGQVGDTPTHPFLAPQQPYFLFTGLSLSGADPATLTITESDDGVVNIGNRFSGIQWPNYTQVTYTDNTANLTLDADNTYLNVASGHAPPLTINITLTDDATHQSANYTEYVAVACYAVGTHITTPVGETTIECLRIGDLVTTVGGKAKPVKWIGRRAYARPFVQANPQIRPVRICAGALGAGIPSRDLLVSPMHALQLDGVFVPAAALVNGVSVDRDADTETVNYVHIELEDHDAILAEGAAAETFVDRDSRGMFQNAAEYLAMFGSEEKAPPCHAPRLEEGFELQAIRRRIAARAGLSHEGAIPGVLAGHIERWQDGKLEGWVVDRNDPASPVELEALVDGAVVARVLANRYRSDLDRAGLAAGCCAFTLALSGTPIRLDQVTVRRVSDGAPLPMPVAVHAAA